VNYASGVLSDPSGFLFFVLSLLLLLRERDVLTAGAISAGVLARESLILVVPIACIAWAVFDAKAGERRIREHAHDDQP
jgi:hypothetical protein